MRWGSRSSGRGPGCSRASGGHLPGWLPLPEVPQYDAPGGAICLAGRHNLLETLRKGELHLGKLKEVHWKGGMGGCRIHPTLPGVADKNSSLPGREALP